MKVLVTGSAGFIGFHLVKQLLERGDEVVGIDNINDYYDVNLKYARLRETGILKNKIVYGQTVRSVEYPNYQFVKLDLTDAEALDDLFKMHNFDSVCNLAAQAGVRYSLVNPRSYIESNINGFINLLECARHHHIKHLLYASSSSVYGLNSKMPFSANDNVDHPISLYAASKKSNELMAHSYSHLFNLPTTALRFFTVYGPWGRPDMAMFLFTKAMLDDKPIEVFNGGDMKRDFTYIDDIIDGIVKVIDNPAQRNEDWNAAAPDPSSSNSPYRIYNIGRGEPVRLMDFITEIEKNLGIIAKKKFLTMQDGDVSKTWADISDLKSLGYQPKVSVKEGIKSFVKWYKDFYNFDEIETKLREINIPILNELPVTR
ncbi:NAD-dependent epimerase [Desertivirga xinjiangensis]|uniref:NAD-dependent epimerase n=1 Tax=Desertivirga xinjiangensis TaxID=539206 RepID=UPI0021092059|nr:NAD-dependent epimerase [Pedobacter xinjiangensis]